MQPRFRCTSLGIIPPLESFYPSVENWSSVKYCENCPIILKTLPCSGSPDSHQGRCLAHAGSAWNSQSPKYDVTVFRTFGENEHWLNFESPITVEFVEHIVKDHVAFSGCIMQIVPRSFIVAIVNKRASFGRQRVGPVGVG